MPYNENNLPRQGAQCRLAKTDNHNSPLLDDTDKADSRDDMTAWAEVVEECIECRLIYGEMIPAHTSLANSPIPAAVQMQSIVAHALSCRFAPDIILDFLKHRFVPGDVVALVAIDPAGGRPFIYHGDPGKGADRCAMIGFIKKHNGLRNLYFGVNPRRAEMRGSDHAAEANDIEARRAVVLDLDFKDAPDTDPDWVRTLTELEPVADRVIDTGNGVQLHFDVEYVYGEEMVASVGLLADAMIATGADNMADLPRLARLPWTVNLPTKAKRARGAVPVMAIVTQDVRPSRGAPRPIADLCADLKDVATRLALPGRKSGTGGDRSPASARTGEKTAEAAPSLGLLRMAMEEMPNDGPFDNRDDWLSLCAAVKGAAMAGGIEAEGREIWLEWCTRWDSGGDVAEDERVWDTMSTPKNGWGTVKRWLEDTNPAGHGRVERAPHFTPLPVSFGLQPVKPFTGSALPPRRWLYGSTFYAGYVSMLVAPGGTGKSALTMVEAVSMATGKVLLPGDTPKRPLRVWYHNGEDDLDEMHRRLAATLKHFGLTHADLGGRLFFTSGRHWPLMLARQGRDGLVVNRDAVERLVDELVKAQIDVLILDPLGAMHTLPENSNEAANLLMAALREIVERSGAAIGLVHHTGKMAAKDMDAAGAGAARGASAFVDGARVVRQLRRAGPKDTGLGIPAPDRWKYVRVDNGKANMAPAGAARWLRLVSVSLNNGTKDYPDGDHVQTVEMWEPAKVQGNITAQDAQRIHAAVVAAPAHERRAKASSSDWIGYLIAREMGLDLGPHGVKAEERAPDQMLNRADVSAVIEAGLRDGWLVETNEKARDRKEAPHIAAGDPPPEPEADPDDTDAD